MRSRIIWMVLICMLFQSPSFFAFPNAAVVHSAGPQSSTAYEEDKKAEISRYRSGRRSFRPSPGYNAPARPVSPRYQAPRRTGFFGGIGSFFAGAFLGSMLFSPFMGGYGHFSFFGLLIDILILYFIIKLIRNLFRRQERH